MFEPGSFRLFIVLYESPYFRCWSYFRWWFYCYFWSFTRIAILFFYIFDSFGVIDFLFNYSIFSFVFKEVKVFLYAEFYTPFTLI